MRAGRQRAARRRQGGFTYFVVLLLVVVTATGALALGTLWQTAERRERERELLEAGRELRRAIEAYRRLPVGGKRQFPPSLEDLLRDPRLPGVRRHLRRIPVDPLTGRAEWGLVHAADGGILGVHSLSQAAPMKSAGFAPDEAGFEGAARHADWVFQVREATAPAPPAGWTTRPPG